MTKTAGPDFGAGVGTQKLPVVRLVVFVVEVAELVALRSITILALGVGFAAITTDGGVVIPDVPSCTRGRPFTKERSSRSDAAKPKIDRIA